MSDTIEQVDQAMLGTIKRHAGLGVALGIGIVIAGVLAVIAPFIAGLSVTIAVGVLMIATGVSRLFLAFKMGTFGRGLLMFLLLIPVLWIRWMLRRRRRRTNPSPEVVEATVRTP